MVVIASKQEDYTSIPVVCDVFIYNLSPSDLEYINKNFWGPDVGRGVVWIVSKFSVKIV